MRGPLREPADHRGHGQREPDGLLHPGDALQKSDLRGWSRGTGHQYLLCVQGSVHFRAFEKQKGFNGTFKRSYMKYCEMLQDLKNEGLIECDAFLLLTANYNTICERNKTRNHILEGVWLEEETIVNQRKVLEKMTNEIVGSINKDTIKKKILDTSSLTKEEVLNKFEEFLNNWERDELEK